MTLILSTIVTHSIIIFFFFFNDTATTEIYTLSLHDALPISGRSQGVDDLLDLLFADQRRCERQEVRPPRARVGWSSGRSEEHTSELQSRLHLVCRLLLEKKKNNTTILNMHRHVMRISRS